MTDKEQHKNKIIYVPRITQLDSTEFDEEINNLLLQELLKIKKYLHPGALNNIKHELNLLVNLLIFHYSVLNSNSTFGQELLNLKYNEPLSKRKAIAYITLAYVMPYLKNRYDDTLGSLHNNTIENILRKTETIIKTVSFINLLVFITHGKYPTLLSRILKLTHGSVGKLNRGVGYNYVTRELLWHGFKELLMFTLPLINLRAIKRKIRMTFFPVPHKFNNKKDVTVNLGAKCVVCDDYPNLPCQISPYCPHLACYYCIKSNVLADIKFTCPLCAETNTISNQLVFLHG